MKQWDASLKQSKTSLMYWKFMFSDVYNRMFHRTFPDGFDIISFTKYVSLNFNVFTEFLTNFNLKSL